ncbi:MAG: Eco57I restriction-modification methylase domain-containing protein [Pirellulaceae bacterium]|nr:Eco57I restriction-modification methylase domain-containing protein [Pirellulaceae bacterium]
MRTGEITAFAAAQQRQFDSSTTPEERKQRGHFGTPAAIAEFMAGLFSRIPTGTVRIVDPGAGVGTLSAAVCQRVLAQRTPRTLDFELWENDPNLIPTLEATMKHCRSALRAAHHEMTFVIRTDDFILANTQKTLFDEGPRPAFHLAILNPPYFKLRKTSPQAQAMAHVVHGQPNIYALFLAVVTDLLLPGGEMVAITPRSYFNGLYFRRFRRWFFSRVVVRQIHAFESRTEAFKDDAVLQENVILHAEKGGSPRDIVLTHSAGRDLADVVRTFYPYGRIIDDSSGDCVVRLATGELEHEIVQAVDALPCRFRQLGFEVSTGPVVNFRSTAFLRHHQTADTAPLLWMHNVRPFVIQFPAKIRKPAHIEVSNFSRKLLLPSGTYVLLKRFTAKEENRRLVAAVLTAADSYNEWVGLENHLNYVHRRDSELTEDEAFGLAAYFNTALVDRYFRAISGNTQVNATEIRAMPVPDESTLRQIGSRIRQLQTIDRATVEHIVAESIRLPRHLAEQLFEVADG